LKERTASFCRVEDYTKQTPIKRKERKKERKKEAIKQTNKKTAVLADSFVFA
jgi:hypothetical protein